MPSKNPRKAEFGDYQTPPDLAAKVCANAEALFGVPRTVIEPTCGIGRFLVAAHLEFGAGTNLIGADINAGHLDQARAALVEIGRSDAKLVRSDFFNLDWPKLLKGARGPFLIVGNPPWVTNSELGLLNSDNLPRKSNFQKLRGLDARTGKSNFDISEWMCIRILEELGGRDAAFALLIKTAVARKVLAHAWTNKLPLSEPAMYSIDAKKHFGAAVEACLFVGRTSSVGDRRCPTYLDLGAARQTGLIGLHDDALIADIEARRQTAALCSGPEDEPEWRSGIKHDCAKVLELHGARGALVNGFGERVDLDDQLLFPLMKSSDIANGPSDTSRWLIVPQRETAQDTSSLEVSAPKTWKYLLSYAQLLDSRKSSIYRGRPRFSIFGVGRYAFAPWKVAISGLYKKLEFRLVGPVDGRPVVFDDTVYFTPCADEQQGRRTLELLESEVSRRFLCSYIFWDAKRPITASVLRRLSLAKLADSGSCAATLHQSGRAEDMTAVRAAAEKPAK